MGTFGFFLFLSILVIAHNWRAVQTAQLRRDLLAQVLASGQQPDVDKLMAFLQPLPRPVVWARLKIAVLVVLASASLLLSWAYWEAGTMPLVIAALFALVVAGATWSHERKIMQAMANTNR